MEVVISKIELQNTVKDPSPLVHRISSLTSGLEVLVPNICKVIPEIRQPQPLDAAYLIAESPARNRVIPRGIISTLMFFTPAHLPLSRTYL